MVQAQIQTVTSPADKAKVAVAGLLLIAGIVGFYLLADMGVYAQWGTFFAGLVLAVAVFGMSSYGRTFFGYVRFSWAEVKKVVWPERKEAVQTTLFVFAFVLVLGLFMLLVDKVIGWILYDLILGWGQS